MVTKGSMGFPLGVGSYGLEGVQGAFREAGNVPYLDLGGAYKSEDTFNNSLSCKPKSCPLYQM